jgi:hypothetical protein
VYLAYSQLVNVFLLTTLTLFWGAGRNTRDGRSIAPESALGILHPENNQAAKGAGLP